MVNNMANVDSYPKHDAKYVLMEHDRTAKHYKNNVDKERTPLNWSYGMCVNVDDVMQAINDRCEAIMCGRKIQNQTNIIQNASWWDFVHRKELLEIL